MQFLTHLDVRNNTLAGPIPVYARSRQWTYLGLAENKFYYTESFSVLNSRKELTSTSDSDIGPYVAELSSTTASRPRRPADHARACLPNRAMPSAPFGARTAPLW